MKAAIITIGDEILVGQTIDTNSTFISKKLREIGFAVFEIRSISDERTSIISALNDLKDEAEVIFITGGLGPTNDDITKKVLCEYYNDELVTNDFVLSRIEEYFNSINREMLPVHYQQAELPSKSTTIINDFGTASGMWFNEDNTHLFSMPGVPYEMKGLMEKIVPIIKEEFNVGDFYHRTIMFQGIGESTLAKTLLEVEEKALANGISMAYLPSVGFVKIRFTGDSSHKDLMESFIKTAKEQFPGQLYGEEDISLEEVVGELLTKTNSTVGTVESCTSGNLAARIVKVPGASNYFEGSLITYSYGLKSKLADVDPDIIINKGAVSEEVIAQMAANGRIKLGVDFCLATSGIAGPGGGTEDKPVGTVWVGLASKDRVLTKKFNFKQNRERNIELTISYALNMLRKELLGIS